MSKEKIMPKGTGGIIEILHTPVLQDSIAESGVPGYILKTLLDVNNPTGALVFVCVIGGIFVVFIAILDSLKPPNFPPGPRWIPFGGDSSAICEKPLTRSTALKLQEKFGPVVGLRQNSGLRNPIILALDATAAETVEQAARNGFLEYRRTESSEFKISDFTGIPPAFRYKIHKILKSDITTELIKKSAHEAANDLNEFLNGSTQQVNSSIILETILSALLNMISGRRVKPSSPCLNELYQILINNAELNCALYNNEWTDNFDIASLTAQYYSKLIMALSEFDEHAGCNSTKNGLLSVFKILEQSQRQLSLQEKSIIIADILIRSNMGHCLVLIAELLNASDDKHFCIQPDQQFSLDSISKEACHNNMSLIYDTLKTLPPLKVGRRWEVLKSFYLNGFTVPQGSSVQTVLLRPQEPYPITEEWISYESLVMNLVSRVFSEVIFIPKALKMFESESVNVINPED